jgi:transcriptional regulator with XRE-family HTH domain
MTGHEFIRAKRLEKGLSFRRLALAAGVCHQSVKNYEDGNKAMTFDNLVKILHGLDVSMFEYLAAINYMKPVTNTSGKMVGDAGIEPAPGCAAA